jgi:putative ABC transport system substrate-binding protein
VRDREIEDTFREALRDLGRIDGRNIHIEARWPDGKRELAARHAAELTRLNVDVMVVSATPAVHAARDATRTIPIVMTGSADPVESGFAATLARPGGNVTGVSLNLPAVAGKRLELLREVLPTVTRVAFLGSRQDPATRLFIEELDRASRKLGVSLHVLLVDGLGDVDAAISDAVRQRAGALIVQPLFSFGRPAAAVAASALRQRLPAVSDFRDFAVGSGLFSYGASRHEPQQRAAAYVDKILNGANPADLPIEEPKRFELVINMRTARTLGVALPHAVLVRADELLQ